MRRSLRDVERRLRRLAAGRTVPVRSSVRDERPLLLLFPLLGLVPLLLLAAFGVAAWMQVSGVVESLEEVNQSIQALTPRPTVGSLPVPLDTTGLGALAAAVNDAVNALGETTEAVRESQQYGRLFYSLLTTGLILFGVWYLIKWAIDNLSGELAVMAIANALIVPFSIAVLEHGGKLSPLELEWRHYVGLACIACFLLGLCIFLYGCGGARLAAWLLNWRTPDREEQLARCSLGFMLIVLAASVALVAGRAEQKADQREEPDQQTGTQSTVAHSLQVQPLETVHFFEVGGSQPQRNLMADLTAEIDSTLSTADASRIRPAVIITGRADCVPIRTAGGTSNPTFAIERAKWLEEQLTTTGESASPAYDVLAGPPFTTARLCPGDMDGDPELRSVSGVVVGVGLHP